VKRTLGLAGGSVRPRTFFWFTFVLLVLTGVCWNVSTPLFNAPDEPEHVIRAASLVRGEIFGRQAPGYKAGYTVVHVPKSFVSGANIGCYAFIKNQPANCPTYSQSGRIVRTAAHFGRYPPAYYAVAGLPTLVVDSPNGVYLVRFVSTLLSSFLIAMGIASLARLRERRMAAVGLAFALTPMTLYFGSVVNPSGLEIAAGISLWACGIVLVLEAREAIDPVMVRRTAIAAIALVLARQLGPLWIVLILALLALLGGRAAWRRLIASRVVRIWGSVVALATGLQVTWILVAGSLNLENPAAGTHDTTSQIIRTAAGAGYFFFVQMIGNFGWLAAPVPNGVVVFWAFALGLLAILALAWGTRLQAAVLGAVIGLSILIPAVLEAYAARQAGYIWQGRYELPFAVGIPIVAAVVLSANANTRAITGGRLLLVLGIGFWCAQVVSFGQSLRRSVVGYDGVILYFTRPIWNPPVSSLLLTLAYMVLVAVLVAWLFRMPAVADSSTATAELAAEPAR